MKEINAEMYGPLPLLSRRVAAAQNLKEKLFALFMLGDDRAISKTYIKGHCAHDRDAP